MIGIKFLGVGTLLDPESVKMIVVFVVDTSPSMGLPLVPKSSDSSAGGGVGMSRLDLAKMFVEDMSRKLLRQRQTHVRVLQQTATAATTGDASAKQQQINDQQRSYRNSQQSVFWLWPVQLDIQNSINEFLMGVVTISVRRYRMFGSAS